MTTRSPAAQPADGPRRDPASRGRASTVRGSTPAVAVDHERRAPCRPVRSIAWTGATSDIVRLRRVVIDASAYIPGTSSSVGFGTSTSVSIVRVSVSSLSAKRATLPVKRPIERLHLDVDRRAEVNARHRRLRHRDDQPQRAVLRQPDDRHRLGLRRGAGLNHRAGVGVAMRDDAGKRRRDPRVGEQRLRLVLARPWRRRAARCAAASAALAVATCASATRSRPCASSMSCCATRFGRCFITAASRVEPRCATSCADSARARSACARLISSLRALDRRPRPVAMSSCSSGISSTASSCPALHAIADVDVDRLHVAGDLGVHLDFLERPELGGQRQRLRQIAASDLRDRRRPAARRRPPPRAIGRTRRPPQAAPPQRPSCRSSCWSSEIPHECAQAVDRKLGRPAERDDV